MNLVLVTHAAATLFMVGLIWFVQIVHYPLMSRVGTAGFTLYGTTHTRLTGYVVAPMMLVEGVSAIWLVWMPAYRSPATLAGLGLLLVIWLSTALLQVPCHRRLCRQFDPGVHRRLVRTNWIRTVAWTIRGGVSLLILGYGV